MIHISDSLILVDTFFASAIFISLFPTPNSQASFAVVSLCCFITSLFLGFWSKVCIHYHPSSHADLARAHEYKALIQPEVHKNRAVSLLTKRFNPPLILFSGVFIMLVGMGVFLFGVLCPSMDGNANVVCYSFSAVTAAPVVMFIFTGWWVWTPTMWEELMEIRTLARSFDREMHYLDYTQHSPPADVVNAARHGHDEQAGGNGAAGNSTLTARRATARVSLNNFRQERQAALTDAEHRWGRNAAEPLIRPAHR